MSFKMWKSSRLIRFFALPFMNIIKNYDHQRYLCSPDSWYLKTLKGVHIGKRCFIIGNGPSLRAKDLDKIKDEYAFAANRIYEIFNQTDWRPQYYMATDKSFIKDNYQKLQYYDLGHMFLRTGENAALDYPMEKMTRIFMDYDSFFRVYKNDNNNWTIYVSEDVSNHIAEGATVTFANIQMALYMGFSEIYLLGVDFSYSVVVDKNGNIHNDPTVKDYFSGKNYNTTSQIYESTLRAYQIAKEYCDNHNIKIYNATRGGKLEVFERVDFDTLFPNNEEEK